MKLFILFTLTFNLFAAQYRASDCHNKLVRIIKDARVKQADDREKFKEEFLNVLYSIRDLKDDRSADSEISVAVNYLFKSPYIQNNYTQKDSVFKEFYYFRLFVREIYHKFHNNRKGASYFSDEDRKLLEKLINASEWNDGIYIKQESKEVKREPKIGYVSGSQINPGAGYQAPVQSKSKPMGRVFTAKNPKHVFLFSVKERDLIVGGVSLSARPKFPTFFNTYWRNGLAKSDMQHAKLEWDAIDSGVAGSRNSFAHTIHHILNSSGHDSAEEFYQDVYSIIKNIHPTCLKNFSKDCKDVFTLAQTALLNTEYVRNEWFFNGHKKLASPLPSMSIHVKTSAEVLSMLKILYREYNYQQFQGNQMSINAMMNLIFNDKHKQFSTMIDLL